MKYDSYDNLPIINCPKSFENKSSEIKKLLKESLQILSCLGIPIDEITERKKEKMAMAFLAVGNIKSSTDWKKIRDSNSEYSVTTKEIIDFDNKYLEDNLSRGSYDYVLRDDLKLLLLADIVIKSKPMANTSNPTRGYKISAEYSRIIRNYGQSDWFKQVETFNSAHPTYEEKISQNRNLTKIKVTTPDGKEIELKDGEHNSIQKSIIEEFLPRFGYGAQLLYCGDSDNKYGLIFEEKKLQELGFSDLKQSKLPDVVAYSPNKDWVYMIEAYHTSNPITATRKIELQKIMGESAKKGIFVTAFENVNSYHKCTEELAWETEIWIATEPDHMQHRDGLRFLGPMVEGK